jgi:hypothetical protein
MMAGTEARFIRTASSKWRQVWDGWAHTEAGRHPDVVSRVGRIGGRQDLLTTVHALDSVSTISISIAGANSRAGRQRRCRRHSLGPR